MSAFEVIARVAGIPYSLSRMDGFRVVGHDGWGYAPIDRLSTRGAQQHGDTDIGFYLAPRFGTIDILLDGSQIAGDAVNNLYALRLQLQRILAPENEITLEFWLTTVMCIDVKYVDGLSITRDQSDVSAARALVKFRAADPTFYHYGGEQVVSYDLVGDGTEVPTEVPTAVGPSRVNVLHNFTYPGNFQTKPRIFIYGPITDPVIESQTTGEILDFTGTTITTGQWFEIDTRYDHQTIVDAWGNDQSWRLADRNDLATFHIAAPIDGTGFRSNGIIVRGTGANSQTRAEIKYLERYLGI